MCMICDGYTLEEVVGWFDLRISVEGFARVSVESEGTSPTLTYTIGLTALGHPELVVLALELEVAAAIIDRLASRVLAGDDLRGLVEVADGDEWFGLLPVHQAHVRRGAFAMWATFHEVLDRAPPPFSALQVIPPPEYLCRRHQLTYPRLDQPGTALGGPNRAERRRRARRRGHGP